jgi:hypothetical protein
MKRVLRRSAIVLLFIWVALAAVRTSAQDAVLPLDKITSQAQLDKTITALDTQLFGAYNHCDLTKFASLLDEHIEFYHDQGGVTLGREKLTESIKNNICTGDTQRVLVPGTLKIYYMKGYGAIEIGVHRFLHPKTEAINGTGEASFMNLWHYEDGAWKLTRAFSYDHHSVKRPTP